MFAKHARRRMRFNRHFLSSTGKRVYSDLWAQGVDVA